MSQQSDMAEEVYDRLASGPVPVADLVSELRTIWGPEHIDSEVHGFVGEVTTCLLWDGDVDVGDFVEGEFESWGLNPSAAQERIDERLASTEGFFSDRFRCVFKRAVLS